MSSSSKSDIEKLRVMLPHWIAHNKGHWEEFEKWALQLEDGGDQDVAKLLRLAVAALRDAQDHLENGLAKLGGGTEHNPHDHHHHHHHH
ncbi:MAG: hypothetical protein OEM02_11495 [Desulfobulbaceae bacterium]|nr:hypothetical protein [Desulfobulbaceae bacterium]